MVSNSDIEVLLNDFAIRCFRDEGDEVYIAARMAYRAGLAANSLWSSHQAIEKYLKCILLLNRIFAKDVLHDLAKALRFIEASPHPPLCLSARTMDFIKRIDELGRFRYLEVSRVAFGLDIVNLDRTVWEIRQFCTLADIPRLLKLKQGEIAPKYELTGGYLEEVVAHKENPAREPLLWNNAFLGRRPRRTVKMKRWLKASNAPLWLNPQMLSEVLKYVYLPKDLVAAYTTHKKPY